MVSGERVRALAAEARRTGSRRDTGPLTAPAPDGGTHFVTLVKPEVLAADDVADTMAETARVLGEAETAILRCAVMPAKDFARRGHLFLHYPRLHRVAADGERALCSGARRALGALASSVAADGVLSAYEAMTFDADLTPAVLEDRCRVAGIHKLGSGSYASVIKTDRRRLVVLNGFLPALYTGYLASSTFVGMLECHSHEEIAALRSGLLGALHPAEAAPGSLRGALGAFARQRHGLALSEGRNGVHLSAGHLEAMFQVWRYFGAADGQAMGDTPFGRSLTGNGVPEDFLTGLLSDHNLVTEDGDTVSPHGATENLSRDEVVGLLSRWAAEGRDSRS